MKFSEHLEKYTLSLEQDNLGEIPRDPNDVPAETDLEKSTNKQKKEQIKVAPEGYVEMVRLMAKALVMNVPPDAIDGLFTQNINGENVEQIREGLEELINTSTNYKDNPERLENPNFIKYYNSINEMNFQKKFKEIINIMKKYSNDVGIG